MPELSRFFGVIIRMYARDHLPPHFHAIYGTEDVSICVSDFRVLAGWLR